MVAWTTTSFADDLPTPAERCTKIRWCSSTGIECAPQDADCKERAREKGLEVVCDVPQRLVYCPARNTRADSGWIWVLLAAALSFGAGGIAIAWTLLRRKDDEPTKEAEPPSPGA